MKRLVAIVVLMLLSLGIYAQTLRDSVHVFFKPGVSHVDTLFLNNVEAMNRLTERYARYRLDSHFHLQRIVVVSSASPEGSLALNVALSKKRADAVVNYLKHYPMLEEQHVEVNSLGVDWQGLRTLVEQSTEMPCRDNVLRVLSCSHNHEQCLAELKALDEGEPYRWLYRHAFPLLRSSLVVFEVKEAPSVVVSRPSLALKADIPHLVARQWVVPSSMASSVPSDTTRNVYWALKTNLLYDAALVPNLGVEVSLGKKWSVAVNWMYAWWSNRGKNNFWRVYGGDVEVRRWFGKKAAEKPLQGHHVGVYGQMATYDFELGGRGYLGDKWAYGAGISYGYSLPVGKRLNMDFTLGLGYLGGEYKEYLPIEGHYVWQVTKHLHWWGPTKAEVSLVWLLGKVNANPRKGGAR